MSQLYPDLTNAFPNSIDPNRSFSDVTSSNKALVEQYYTYKSSGNDSAATDLLNNNPNLKNTIVTAEMIQLIYDMNISQQRFYLNDVQQYLVNIVKQKGNWNETTTYTKYDVVQYVVNGAIQSYMGAVVNIPTGTLPTNTSYYVPITLRGEQGASGTGLSVRGVWNSLDTYYVNDCVSLNNAMWYAIVENTNNTPNDLSTYWKKFADLPTPIRVSSTQPNAQNVGDEWHQISDTDNSLAIKVKQADGSYVAKNVVSNASFIADANGNTVQGHIDNAAAHITTATHTRTGTVNNLAVDPGTKNLTFLATADLADGDTWTVNGQPVTAKLQNGEALPGELFKAGCWVTGVRLSDDGTQLFFKSAGESVKYNVFCQPTEPTTKTGIWLKTDAVVKPKKIVFDDNIWAAGQWQNPSLIANTPAKCKSSVVINGVVYACDGARIYKYDFLTNEYTIEATLPAQRIDPAVVAYGGEIYFFGGYMSGSYVNTAIAYNTDTKTFRTLSNMITNRNSGVPSVYNSKIYIFSGFNNISTSAKAYNKAEVYNPTTDSYSALADLPSDENRFDADTFDTEIFMFGGVDTRLANWAYNPSTNIYRTLPASGMYNYPGVVRKDSLLYILGGYGASPMKTVKSFNPLTNLYQTVDDMPNGRNEFTPVFTAGKILAISGNSSNVVDCMDFTAKQYPINPSALIYTPPKDLPYTAPILASKLIDALPVLFKDSMLFADGNITFPALYIGDSTQWTLARAAQ